MCHSAVSCFICKLQFNEKFADTALAATSHHQKGCHAMLCSLIWPRGSGLLSWPCSQSGEQHHQIDCSAWVCIGGIANMWGASVLQKRHQGETNMIVLGPRPSLAPSFPSPCAVLLSVLPRGMSLCVHAISMLYFRPPICCLPQAVMHTDPEQWGPGSDISVVLTWCLGGQVVEACMFLQML